MTERLTRLPIRLAITGGGTGGHVLPARAAVEELASRGLLAAALWIGSTTGVEREAAKNAGIPYRPIETGKFRRYLAAQTLVDAGRVPVGVIQARLALHSFRPDVLFSTGGFVSVPAVIAARGLCPVLTHEQTAILGLANRINARFADVLAITWPQTAAAARRLHRTVVVTGNPVRASLAHGDPSRGRAAFGFSEDRPLLYVTGGARGASPLNTRLAALLPDLLATCQVLHQTGPAAANPDHAALLARRATWPPHLQERYVPVEFVGDELPDVYAAADLILGRAGAGTVTELAFLGKPAVLVPLPGAGGDEQTRNARLLADAGAAVLLPQAEASPDRLRDLILEFLAEPVRCRHMAARARSLAVPDAAARLADVLLDLAVSRHKGPCSPGPSESRPP